MKMENNIQNNKFNITINGINFEVDSGITILEACKKNGFKIPTLCHLRDGLGSPSSCRICVVEVEGGRTLTPSCSTPIANNMKITTNSERVIKARKMNYQLLMASHPDCLSCQKNNMCELQKIGHELDIKERIFEKNLERKIDDSAPAYVRDNNKCILCQKCVNVCENVIGVSCINFIGRGHNVRIGNAFDENILDSECIECGQCILNCPTGALMEKNEIEPVLKAINNPKKYVIAQTAPAVRVALGEGFGMPAGSLVTGKMVEALKRIGFDRVLDTTLGADFTIMEEGFELLKRIESGQNLPQFTSCCPAWVKYVESFYPELIPNLSTAKSPHQMFGAIIKAYYSKEYGIDPKDIINVSIMPCTSKKYERQRNEMNAHEGLMDVDYVLTTRELVKLINQSNIDFLSLPDRDFDPLGNGTGAGDIFGASGGVMEAALRTAYEVKTGKRLEKVEFEQIRGHKMVKEGSIMFDDKEIKFLVVATPKEAKPFIEQAKAGKSPYHFIEVMVCPGGCIAGGGQPIPTNPEIVKKRMLGLYVSDAQKTIRRSYENPIIKKVYAEFLGEPLSEKAEHYLHTKFINRSEDLYK